jgi:uncharacterized protein YrzB (UPF0473 family)
MNNEDMRFTMLNEQGEETECEILFTFEMNGLEYVVYTDHTRTEAGELNVFAGIIGDDDRLLPVETEEEWAVIQEQMEQLIAQIKDEEE